MHMRALLNPVRYGVFSLQLSMHKLMRFLTPVFLLTALGSLAALAAIGQYRPLFLLVVTGMALCVLVVRAAPTRDGSRIMRVFHFGYYYMMVNYAVGLAWFNILRNRRMTVWAPERKQA